MEILLQAECLFKVQIITPIDLLLKPIVNATVELLKGRPQMTSRHKPYS